ncbi:hypothetical protein Tco_0191226 [Tanacetum coccineum]
MGTFRETLAEGNEGALHLGPTSRTRLESTLTLYLKISSDITWQDIPGSELTNKDRESQLYDNFEHFRQNKGETIHTSHDSSFPPKAMGERHQRHAKHQDDHGRQNRGQGNNARGGGVAGYGGAQNRVGSANPDVDEQPVQDLTLNVDNVFQADDCDAFDSDVDEAPTAQTMFMANLSSADPVYDEAGPFYDSDILSEVHNHDHYQDAICEHHEEHEMHDDVQPTYVVDSHVDYTSDNNMIPYDQYVKDYTVPVVQSNVSSIPNDAYMMIFNDMHEPHLPNMSL